MTPREIAEKIDFEYSHCFDKNIRREYIESLLTEALDEAFDKGVKAFKAEFVTKQELHDAKAEAYEECARIAEDYECSIARGSETCQCAEELSGKIRLRAKELK